MISRARGQPEEPFAFLHFFSRLKFSFLLLFLWLICKHKLVAEVQSVGIK